jgi:hypothetical protein
MGPPKGLGSTQSLLLRKQPFRVHLRKERPSIGLSCLRRRGPRIVVGVSGEGADPAAQGHKRGIESRISGHAHPPPDAHAGLAKDPRRLLWGEAANPGTAHRLRRVPLDTTPCALWQTRSWRAVKRREGSPGPRSGCARRGPHPANSATSPIRLRLAPDRSRRRHRRTPFPSRSRALQARPGAGNWDSGPRRSSVHQWPLQLAPEVDLERDLAWRSPRRSGLGHAARNLECRYSGRDLSGR